jgi:hypothetical protein
MSTDVINVLCVLGYLFIGTFGIALLAGWALKRPGSRPKPRSTNHAASNGKRARKIMSNSRALASIGLLLATSAYQVKWSLLLVAV